ncbi:MAG: DUF177 domain-containing protein [Candidatus Eisenbacteria bacterium]|uniref:DUF177 domain-containing protein n=1 Tax=Eiseniibacteriota bacterium TaxID=2212470 RepID=A0A956RP53_UNCEI|nr:DUF177 domain-containing protein [Candidatus Eisenbacteria bacterium]
MHDSGAFVVRIATLDEGESHRELIGTAGELDLTEAGFQTEAPVVFRARIYRVGNRIEVNGTVTAGLRLACGKCLEEFDQRIQVDVRVYAEPRPSRDHRPEEEVREDDLGMVYHDGQILDLTEEVRQSVLVEVPWHPQCREDCRGLCPRCGTNWNTAQCSCDLEPHDSRWEALREMLKKRN